MNIQRDWSEDDLVSDWVTLNEIMVINQKLTLDDIQSIISLHHQRCDVIDTMTTSTDRDQLRKMAAQVTELDYQLQDAWKFDRDVNFHRFWNLPQCSCPKMDNDEMFPSGAVVITNTCILHGT